MGAVFDNLDEYTEQTLRELLAIPEASSRIYCLIHDLFDKESTLYFKAVYFDNTWGGEINTWTIRGLGSVFQAKSVYQGCEIETFHSYKEARKWIDEWIDYARYRFMSSQEDAESESEEDDDEDEKEYEEFPLTIEVDIKPEDEGNDSKETA